jgi:hypothetical protein
MRSHHAATQASGGIQRTGKVDFRTAVVPAPGTQAGVPLKLTGRLLAHQIDRPGRIACSRQQACCAAQHFHPVVDGEVGLRLGNVLGDDIGGRDNAVVLVVVDVIAARRMENRLAPMFCTEIPGVRSSTVSMLSMPSSSMRWRVITLMDCGSRAAS